MMHTEHKQQRGVSLSGLIFWSVLLGALAMLGMRLFPLYNEKMKVDLALEKVAKDAASGGQSKYELIKSIMKQFEVSDVNRWSTADFTKLLHVEKKRNSDARVMSLDYEIRNPICCNLDIVLNYHNAHELSAGPVE